MKSRASQNDFNICIKGETVKVILFFGTAIAYGKMLKYESKELVEDFGAKVKINTVK